MDQHKTYATLPKTAQVEAELQRLEQETQKRRKVALPDPEQVSAERARLKKRENRKAARLRDLKQTPVQQPKKKNGGTGVALPSMEAVVAERESLRYRAKFQQTLRNTLGILIVVADAAALMSTLFLPVLQVSGTSMEPTLNNNDVIVLFKSDELETGQLVGLYYNGKIMLKRIIGKPGDFIHMDPDGNVYINGDYVEEPYLSGKSLGDCDISFPYQVPEGRYFVLGDHRSVSTDSRNSLIGCIPSDQIIGRVVVRIWPLSEVSLIH